jgi:hypothetical protein
MATPSPSQDAREAIVLGLALKKTLLDLWEQAVVIVSGNVLLSACGFALFLLVDAAAARGLGFGAMSLAAALIVFAGVLGVAAGVVETLHHRDVPDWRALAGAIRCYAGPAAIAGATALGLLSLMLLLSPKGPSPFAVMAHVVLIWIAAVSAEIFLFQLAATPLLGPGRALHGAIFLAFNSPGYSAGILLLSALFFCTAVMFFPGPLGALYLTRIAVLWRLRTSGLGDSYHADWREDLAREHRALGCRGLLNTLFPWKG